MSTWVLLRGLTRERRHWDDFPARLQAGLGVPPAGGSDVVPVIALDLPGNGVRYRERSDTRVDASAGFCRAELQRLGLPPPYRVLALSLGAMVAVAWARRHPQELDGCVLVNTSLRGISPFYQRLQPRSYGALLRVLLGRDVRRREQAVMQLTTCLMSREPTASRDPHGSTMRQAHIDRWVELYRTCPVSRANALRQLLAALRCRDGGAAPSVPVLLLSGAGDRLVDPRCSQSLAQRWGCAHAEHPQAGHDLPLDDPDWVIDRLRHWSAPAG